MTTVSLCMIVRNEEKVLARCLDSVRGIADEICITDTGSTDKTREIAKNTALCRCSRGAMILLPQFFVCTGVHGLYAVAGCG